MVHPLSKGTLAYRSFESPAKLFSYFFGGGETEDAAQVLFTQLRGGEREILRLADDAKRPRLKQHPSIQRAIQPAREGGRKVLLSVLQVEGHAQNSNVVYTVERRREGDAVGPNGAERDVFGEPGMDVLFTRRDGMMAGRVCVCERDECLQVLRDAV